MTEKRFKVAVYDDKAINGFAVLDLQKPNSSKRLEYENVYIGSKAGCEIVCNFGNNLAEENEKLKQSYIQLKHRHSLLHDVCLDAECDRDGYHKDVLSLEKENEQLKQCLDEAEDIIMSQCTSYYQRQYQNIKRSCKNEF